VGIGIRLLRQRLLLEIVLGLFVLIWREEEGKVGGDLRRNVLRLKSLGHPGLSKRL
jgi:hypothetical protein